MIHLNLRKPYFLGALGLFVLVSSTNLAAGDWPQFRGARGDGSSDETGLLESWPEGGPQLIWRKALGEGFSGITISKGKLYTLTQTAEGETKTEYAVAFDPETGGELWRTPIGEGFDDTFGNGPRSSPTIDDTQLYAFSSRGNLVVLKLSDGAKVWEKDFIKDFEAKMPTFGFSTSPLVDGDSVFIEIGAGEGKYFAAFDRNNGKKLWTTLDGGPGYTTPIIVTVADTKQIVIAKRGEVAALDLSGNFLWKHHWEDSTSAIATPLFLAPDKFFISATGQGGALLLRAFKEGDEWKTEDVWRNRNLKNHFSSSVLHKGFIYGFDNATLKCISSENGEQAWAKRGFGKGSLIQADGKLIVLSDRGLLVQAEATPQAYKEMGQVQAMEKKCWTSPTLVDGKLYLRNHEEMVVYNLNKAEPVQ